MNKDKKFFDAEFEIDLLNYQFILQTIKNRAQTIKNWLLTAFLILLCIGLGLQNKKIIDLQDSMAIMQCEKDAQKIGASFTFVDGECSMLYSE